MALSTLVALAPDVFAYDFVERLPIGAKMPVRMTVVRLPEGSLWVHSPAKLSEALLKDLNSLGPVRHIVAPNRLHHLHFGAFAQRYPEATTYGAPGLAQKRPDLTFSETLSNTPPDAWSNQLHPVVLEGAPKQGEVVFYHRPSRSLIVADLVFNVTRPDGFMTNVLLGMTGTRGKLAQSRVWGPLVSDRVAFTEASLASCLSSSIASWSPTGRSLTEAPRTRFGPRFDSRQTRASQPLSRPLNGHVCARRPFSWMQVFSSLLSRLRSFSPLDEATGAYGSVLGS